MPRVVARKTKIGSFSEELMQEAVERVVIDEISCRKVAKDFSLAHQTLARYVKKQKQSSGCFVKMRPHYDVRKIFTTEEEDALQDYIVKSCNMMYGLSYEDVRKMAYEMAIINNKKHPVNWDQFQKAGKEWLRGFMRRHSQLSLRTAEGCSLGRAIAFNKENTNRFYKLLEDVMKRQPEFADGTRVYNLDETGTTTVQKTNKVVAPRGQKQVSHVTSGEKGTLVTTCVIVSATGNDVPPIMIFSRKFFKSHMLRGAPSGTLGLANPSGWMTRELFLDVMKHFIKHTKSSIDHPTLLIYDNHESHLSLQVLDLAKANGVTILTIPPHCSNNLQPLDVGVFRAFSTAYNAAISSWMMRNPGNPMTIYEIAECVGTSYGKSVTRQNITSSFRKTGIFPFDKNVFSEVDFMPALVTDRPNPDMEQLSINFDDPGEGPSSSNSRANGIPSTVQQQAVAAVEQDATQANLPEDTNSSADHHTPSNEFEDKRFISPEDIRGLPNTRCIKKTGKRRTKGKSMIATDTPERNEIAVRQAKKQRIENEQEKKRAKRKIKLEETPVRMGNIESEKKTTSGGVEAS